MANVFVCFVPFVLHSSWFTAGQKCAVIGE